MAKKAESGGYARLKGDLAQKTPGSFYVLYGEEDYLRRYYLSMLRRQLVDGPTEDFNFHRLTSENFSMQVLSESLEALPMMAERTMIQVDDVDLFALPEDDRTQLAALFSDIPDYACLVLVYADFKPDKRKKKLWTPWRKTPCWRSSPTRPSATSRRGSCGTSVRRKRIFRLRSAATCCSAAARP